MRMSGRYTIGQLARAVSVPTSTVRYYERIRLLEQDGRTESNYRYYGPEALRRLQFIRAAQAHGFTLQDVATMLDLRDGRTAPCREVQTLIEQRLADLEQRVRQLHHLQAVLRDFLKLCLRSQRTGRCRVVDELDGAASRTADPLPARWPVSRRGRR
ncbi:MAG: heavy metal-responsive transcriptional regulator [Acidobacteriota bacterium]